MDDERQNAYRYLLYQATLDIRMTAWQEFRWWSPLGFYRSLRAARFAGHLADAMHNLAMYSSIGFDKFDEGLFWERMEYLCSEFPDFASLVGRYRHRFEMLLFESEFGREPDRQKALERIAGSKADRIEFHSEATPSIVSEIELGVLFVMAFWSGAAIFAFRDLLDVCCQPRSGKAVTDRGRRCRYGDRVSVYRAVQRTTARQGRDVLDSRWADRG